MTGTITAFHYAHVHSENDNQASRMFREARESGWTSDEIHKWGRATCPRCSKDGLVQAGLDLRVICARRAATLEEDYTKVLARWRKEDEHCLMEIKRCAAL